MIRTLLNKLDSLSKENLITNSYGIARSILAGGTFLTLLLNPVYIIFPSSEVMSREGASWIVNISLFEVLDDHLVIAKLIALLILFLVIIGLYPRYTGILHWYVAFSFFSSCSVIDGGDHAASVFSFLLIPLTLLDKRKWHWSKYKEQNRPIKNIVAWINIVVIRIQASILYLHAGLAKLNVEEWVNGTATYYWFTHHYHGAADWLKPVVISVLSTNLVVLITWGAIVFELTLFAAIFLRPDSSRRKLLLMLGVLFHFSIAIIHGLVSFFFTMTAIVVLYLHDHSKYIPMSKWKIFKIIPQHN